MAAFITAQDEGACDYDALTVTSCASPAAACHVFAALANTENASRPVATTANLRAGKDQPTGWGRKAVHALLLSATAVKGIRHGNVTTFTLSPISKGAVFWYEP
jgi:hypothetical protein